MNIKSIQNLIISMFDTKPFVTKLDILNEILKTSKNKDKESYDEYSYTVSNLLKDFCQKNTLYKKGSKPNERYYMYQKEELKPKEIGEEQLSVFLDNDKTKKNVIKDKNTSEKSMENKKNLSNLSDSRDKLNKLYYIDFIKAENVEVSYLSEYLDELRKEINLFTSNFKKISNPEKVLEINEFLLYVNINKIIMRKQEEVESIMDKIKADKEYIKNKELLQFSKDLSSEIDNLLLKIEDKLPNRRVEREFELNASEAEKAWYYEFLDYTFRLEDLRDILREESDDNE